MPGRCRPTKARREEEVEEEKKKKRTTRLLLSAALPSPLRCPSRRLIAWQEQARMLLLLSQEKEPSSRRRRRGLEGEFFSRLRESFSSIVSLSSALSLSPLFCFRALSFSPFSRCSPTASESEVSVSVEASAEAAFLLLPQRSQIACVFDVDEKCRRRR